VLYRHKHDSLNRSLAFTLAALILFAVSHAFAFLALKMQGQVTETRLIMGVFDLYAQGMLVLATLVLLTTIVVPAVQLMPLLYMLMPLKFGRVPWRLPQMFRLLLGLTLWSMMDIFMLGILVSIVKLVGMATLVPGLALWSFALLIVALTAATSSLDPHVVWDQMAADLHSQAPIPATRRLLLGCHTCGLLVQGPAHRPHVHLRCPRCRASLHARKPDSIVRTWALVIAALMLYLPANLLPMMTVTSLGRTQSDTIMSGVIYLLLHGLWPLALLVFFASVVVPLLKLMALIYLLISVQCGSRWRPYDRTRLYRLTESVGRWSMVDVYVVTILVALVRLGNLATIQAGPGAVFFGARVVITLRFPRRWCKPAADSPSSG
jgi:paraquat-inducible protein A